jgi:diguanylate cyclase (GGDEF)-like protein
MTGYIVVMSVSISIAQTWAASPERMFWATLVTAVAAAVMSLPITWEFGRMYLDLWDATQSLKDLAKTDQQTGLLNNRSFIEATQERLASGRRTALLLGDLDRFKAINDRYGHLAGDAVIAAVGERLRGLFGSTAIVGRMGGEEFAVAIDCPFREPEIARIHLASYAEEMRRRISELRFFADAGVIRPTISIGVACGEPGEGFSPLYARADRALYLAKAAGRDRVVDEFVFPTDLTASPERTESEAARAAVSPPAETPAPAPAPAPTAASSSTIAASVRRSA